MKFLHFLIVILIGSPISVLANADTAGSGTAVIDERDLKGLETSRERQGELETGRENSFDKVDKAKEDEAEEARELKDRREEMEDDPFIDNYGNGETTNRRINK